MSNQVSTADLAFRRDFESAILSPAGFDHAAHVRLAYVLPVRKRRRGFGLHAHARIAAALPRGAWHRPREVFERDIMLTHYSKELLFSETARQQFREPDRAPIPRHA